MKKISKIKFLLISLLFLGCERDLYEESFKLNNEKYSSKKITYSEFKQNSKAFEKFKYFKSSLNSDELRGVYNETFNIYIDTTNIIVTETDSKYSITFQIVNNNIINKIENLVLSLSDNGNYDAYKTEYLLTQTELNYLLDPNNSIEKEPEAITNLDENLRVSLSSGCITTVVVTNHYCTDAAGNTISSEGDLENNCASMSWTVTTTIFTIDFGCNTPSGPSSGSPVPGTTNPGDNDSSTGDNGNSGTTGTGNQTGGSPVGGTGNTAPNNPLDESPVLTTPILTFNKTEARILNFLNENQAYWWFHICTPEVKAEIINFFDTNGFEINNINLIKVIIDVSAQNAGVANYNLFLNDILNLIQQNQITFISNLEEIAEYLNNEQYDPVAVKDALLTFVTKNSNTPWASNTGSYNNVPTLSYSQTRTVYSNNRPLYQYKLLNGDILSTGDYSPPGEGIVMIETYYWSQSDPINWYRIPEPTTYSHLSLDFLFNQFWSVVQTGVRICTPLEEIVVLIEGKDFDGVAQSKAAAGIFVLIDITPVGKVTKITRRAGHALSSVSPVVAKVLTALEKSQRNLRKQYKNIISTMNNTRKGNFGEICTDVDFFEKGYEVLHTSRITNIDQAGHQGIDHIFKNPQTGEFVIVESKYHGSGGLNPGNPATGLDPQMSDAWISNGQQNNTDRLWVALGGDLSLYNQIRPNATTLNYTRVVAYVQPNGTINYKYVTSQGVEISTVFTN